MSENEAAVQVERSTGSALKWLNLALWVVQFVLAALFGMAGFMKLTMPIDELAKNVPWVPEVPVALVRFIGASELAGALGLLLPALTRIKPILTPLAAIGLATVMLLAIPFHLSRGEASILYVPLTLGALAAFIAWGRWRKVPIASKR
jgi:putative oxidoreductase